MLFLFAVFPGNSEIRVPRLGTAFELILPGVEELPLQLQLAGQLMNVLAGLHTFDDLPFELQGVTTPLRLLRHLLAPFDAKCVYSECLTFGVQSMNTKIAYPRSSAFIRGHFFQSSNGSMRFSQLSQMGPAREGKRWPPGRSWNSTSSQRRRNRRPYCSGRSAG